MANRAAGFDCTAAITCGSVMDGVPGGDPEHVARKVAREEGVEQRSHVAGVLRLQQRAPDHSAHQERAVVLGGVGLHEVERDAAAERVRHQEAAVRLPLELAGEDAAHLVHPLRAVLHGDAVVRPARVGNRRSPGRPAGRGSHRSCPGRAGPRGSRRRAPRARSRWRRRSMSSARPGRTAHRARWCPERSVPTGQCQEG